MKLLAVALTSLLGASMGCQSEPASDQSVPPKVAENAGEPERAQQEESEPEEAAPGQALPPEAVSSEPGDGDLVGRVSRQMIEEQRADWKEAVAEASPDEEAARALADVEPGASITVYFGAWCKDCQREVPRFFRALDIAKDVSFTYELIGVDEYFRADEVSQEPLDLPAIPTFVVERDGKEVGRVVEKAPEGIEKELLSLLRGEKTGVVSATK